MSVKISSTKQPKMEENATLVLFHKVRIESGPLEGKTFDLQEVFLSFPNTITKKLNQYNNWKIKDTKKLSENFPTKRLKTEDNMMVNWIQSLRKDSSTVQGLTVKFLVFFPVTSEQVSKTNWKRQIIEYQRDKIVCWNFFGEPTKHESERDTKFFP